jgi:hypothetical protein
MHGTSNTSNQWTKIFILVSEYLGVRGSALQALDFDDVCEELLLLDEEDFVAALQGAPHQHTLMYTVMHPAFQRRRSLMAAMQCRLIGMSDQPPRCLWGLAAQNVPTVS